jgi:hypothetical protein
MNPPRPTLRPGRFVAGKLVLTLSAACLIPGWLSAAPAYIRGSLGIHDPSTVIRCNGRYYVFSTGQGIASKSSADKEFWVTGPSVFSSPPAWTTGAVPGFTGNFWAPDVIYFNGLYHLYYSCSTFGSQVSAIGLATNPTLDPTDPGYLWTDQGAVVQSTTGSAYNCIDPSVAFDASGNLWMSFGSFWNGIYMVRLDATTGLLHSTPTLTWLAFNNASGDPIEASCLFYRAGYYYLFVDWGSCCSGIDSTYNIRVGRSSSITGPYLDRSGVDMRSGGGTLFLKTTGKYIGPGHAGILNEDGTNFFLGYHYYDANANGASYFDLEPLSWTADGWPLFVNDWSAVYRFQTDARDDNGEYYGLMLNGASVRYDATLGSVLNLNGTNQYVNLPDGAANACTFAAVFKWNGGTNWQRIIDFGRSTNRYAFLTPQAATGKIRFTLTSSGLSGEKSIDSPAACPVGAWTHVAATTDGSRGILYVNGTPVATNATLTLTPPDLAPTNTWFGRSPFAADPYFNGLISSIRLHGRALSPAEIVAPQPAITSPAAGSFYAPGTVLSFAGAAADFADAPLAVTSLTWTVEFRDAGVTNVVFGPVIGVSGGSYAIPMNGPEATNGFHRIVLAAIDTVGRAATNWVDVFPDPTGTNWLAFYPFDNGAADANGWFDGTLQNGATTPSDLIRGPVLNLNGVNQYISLPPGIGALRTFSGWVYYGGGGLWQRIFDFGVNTNQYAMLTAKANNGLPRFEIKSVVAGGSRTVDAPTPLPTNRWTHLAVTLDGRQAVLFVNGRAVAVNSSVNLLPSDVLGAANYLGRSQYAVVTPPDPYWNGKLDSVQISSQCLTIEQITASTLGISNGLTSLTLNWPAWTNGLVLHSALDLAAAWTPVTNAPVVTNGVNFLTLTPANDQSFFRLQLP